MREFQYIINKYLLNREKHKKYLAFVLALSMLVSFAVPLSLMQPADSMTIDKSHLATQLSMATPGIPSALPGTDMLDISSADEWIANISNNDNYFYEATQAGVKTNNKFSTAIDSLNLGFYIEYNFKENVSSYLTGVGPHLAWDLGNDQLTARFPNGASYGEIDDPDYTVGRAGTYVIEGGIIKITLDSEYIDYVKKGTGELKGSLQFSGELSRSQSETGDQSFTMAGQTVIVDFPDQNAKPTNKTAKVNSNNGTIEWEITIDNSKMVDMTGYILEDEMLKDATSITFIPEDAATFDLGQGKTTIGFTDKTKNAQWITIKYVTRITEEQLKKVEGSATNTATLKKGNNDYGKVTATADFNKKPIIVSKNGTADYESGSYNGKIDWTVEVKNDYGLSLDGYVIEDPKLPEGAQVSNGTLTHLGGNKWQLNTTASSVKITYTTNAVEGTNSNSVKVYYDKDETDPVRDGTTNKDVTYNKISDLITLDKFSTTNTDGTIEWRLNVINLKRLDLTNYILTDLMLSSATQVNIPTAWVNGTQMPVAEHNGDTITFTAAAKDQQSITITYKTPITLEQLKDSGTSRENKVELKDKNNPDNPPIHTDIEEARFDKGTVFTVTKSAKADYETGRHDGKINWTITINNPYGVSMDGYLIEDDKIPTGREWPVSPSGTLKQDGSGKWKLEGTNGAKSISITYQTENASIGMNYNTATLHYPDGTPSVGKDTGEINYKSEADLIDISKSGWYNQDTHEVNWTININVQGGLSLDGYEVTDEEFPSSLDEITFNPSSAKNYATLTDGKITFGNYQGSVSLSYKTKVDLSGKTGTYKESNDVGIGNGTNNKTTTGYADVTVRKDMQKKSNQGSTSITNNKEHTRTLSWTADITLDDKFAGKSYVDTLKQPTNGLHIITDAQLNAIQITARKEQYGPSTPLTLGTDFTVTSNDGGKSFTITFNETLDVAGYNFLTINYNTTATAYAPASDASYPITYVFGNSATFNEITDNDNDWTLTRNNPEKNDTLNLTVEKQWWNDTENTRPDNITTRILYYTSADTTLRALRVSSDGKYLYYGDEGYDAASEEIILDSNGGWRKTFDGLRKEIVKADENGYPGTSLFYYYKVEEIKVNGQNLENGLYEVTDGFYQVWYENNGGIRADGLIKIINNFNRNTQVTPRKLWTGDAGTGTGFNSVTVQLEYSTDGGGTKYPVKILNGEYIFDANGTTAGAEIAVQELTSESNWEGTQWSNLPSIIVVNGAAVSCRYFIRETAVTDTEGTVIPITGTRFVTSDGYYNVNNSAGDGSLTITNEFKKNTTYTIGATKAWSGDVYNTDSRPAVVLVQLQQHKSTNWGTWTPYGDSHTVELSADNANGWRCSFDNLPNQEVAADGTVTTYKYRIMEVGYKMTTDSDPVMFGKEIYSFATDENGYYNISYSSNDFSQSGTVNITNNFVPVPTLTLTPKKKWVGDADFASTNRPKSVTFTLQRRLGYNGDWENVTGTDGNDITVTLNDENATTQTENVWNSSTYQNEEVSVTYWNSDALPNLPAKVIKRNADGSYTEYYCQYRFVETSYVSANGTPTTIPAGATEFKTEDGKYTFTIPETSQTGTIEVTNTFEQSIGISKTIATAAGDLPATLDKENLVQHKYIIDGVEYYVFNWLLAFDSTKNDLIRPVVDYLPDGFTLCIDSTVGVKVVPDNSTNSTAYTSLEPQYLDGFFKTPVFIYPGNFVNRANQLEADSMSTIFSDKWENSEWFCYDPETNVVAFNKPQIWADMYIGYATKIPCEDLEKLIADQSYTIQNNAVKYEKDGTATDETASASLKITNPIDTNLITKSYSETRIPGSVQYSLNINPEGKNLSTGDTIDIQDLFETVSYLDHDYNGGETTPGKKLVDVLMSNIKLYEVDANGNKIELNSSDYTLMFQTGSDVSDGAALMKLTIPDEKHIVVDYTYKLIANASTPSVIHGCKSSTRVNGRYVPMAPGLVPPAGDTITFSNTASLKSDSADSSDSKLNTNYEIAESSGTISTNTLPSIKKVNTGDYSIDNLEAKFLMARYENGKWHYVDYAKLMNANKGEYDITWSPTGADGTRITSDAVEIDIKAGSDFKVALEQNVLYKLIEIAVPEDYEGSNLNLNENDGFKNLIFAYLNDGATYYDGKDYSVFLNHYISTHYFTYNSTVNTYPDGITSSDVIQVKSGDDVEIPNNKLIDIDVKKQWVNPVTAIRDSKITVELYWSYTKGSTGIPTDAVLATAEDLGIMDEAFSATKTITVTDEAAEDVWKDLPNGIGRRPIYYYIKEVAYEINGKVYELDDDGSYKAETGEVGAYMPTYSGNAANDDTVIDVRNSSQLMLKKEWKNSANVPMQNIPTNGVVVSIYGIYAEDGSQTNEPLFEGVELSVANNWTADITSLLTPEIDLSEYKAFVAVENENPDLQGYVVSCVFNLNAQTGEIIVTNKNTAATEASVTVNKLWSDGETLHANESIEVTLWRSLTELTDLTDLATKLSLMMNAGNTEIMKDADDQECRVTLNVENGWTHTWTGLPLEDENMKKYHYYVVENMSGVQDADKYDETYIVTSKTPTRTEYTVKNYRNAIMVEKVWKGEGNTELTADQLAALNIDSITLDVMKEVATVPEDGLNIVAFGDSITDGYWQGSNPYPYQMTSILTGEDYGYTLTNLENGYIRKRGNSGWKIGSDKNNGLRSQISNQVTVDADIVCFIGGTNDIHQYDSGGNNAFINPTECMNRLKACIEEIQEHVTNEDMIVLVGSIPYFDFLKADGTSTTTGYDYWDYNGFKSKYESVALAEEAANDYIDQYNALIKAYAGETDGVYFVDVCSVVDKDTMSYDGCHPNNEGYAAIANAFAAAINEAYNQSSTVTQVTLTPENNWMAAVDIEDTDTSIKYYVNESDLPAGWTVSYANNAQSVGSSTPITVTNTRHTPKTDLAVEKIWQNDSGNTSLRANMTFALLRSTDGVNWEEVEGVTPDREGNNDDPTWTFQYEDLPAEDNTGKPYYYKVEEDPLDGYTVSYGTPSSVKAEAGGDSGTLQMTNTRAISLNLKKIWSDGNENHTSGTDKVIVRVYRTAGIAGNVPEIPTVDLVFQIAGTAAVGVGKETTLVANKNIASAESGDINIAEVSFEDDTLTIIGKGEGKTTIKVCDENGVERQIEVTVSALAMYLNGGTNFTVVAGQEYTLSAKKGDDTVAATFTSSNSTILSVNGTTLKANNINTTGEPITVTAEFEGLTITQEITIVLPDTFNITSNSTTNKTTIGNRIELGIDKNYGNFEWESSAPGVVEIVEEDGKIYAVGRAVGSATITATRTNDDTTNANTFTVTVENGDIFENVGGVVITLYEGDTEELTSSTKIQQVSNNSNDSSVDATLSNDKITVTGKAPGEAIITVKGGNNWEYTTTFKVVVKERFKVTPATKTLAYGDSVTLTFNKEGAVEYTIERGANLIEISGNTVTAKSGAEGTAVITAKNTVTGETATVTIDVVSEIRVPVLTDVAFQQNIDLSAYDYQNIKALGFKFTHNPNANRNDANGYITFGNVGRSYSDGAWNDEGLLVISFSGQQNAILYVNNYNGYPITDLEEVHIYYDDPVAPTSLSLRTITPTNTAKATNSDITPMSNDVELAAELNGKTITFKPSDTNPLIEVAEVDIELVNTAGQNFEAVLENLDVYTSDGVTPYYYWIEEVSTHTGYTDNYLYTDGDDTSKYWINAAAPAANGFELRIDNVKVEVEDEGVIMPSTGGSGTQWYYIVGMITMLSGAAGYFVLKRKQSSER